MILREESNGAFQVVDGIDSNGASSQMPFYFRQVIPKFAEELCQKDLRNNDRASGCGFSLTADMHRRGIGVRHMGLLRDMFWRPLHGNVDLSFNSNRVRTKSDMRLQLRRGDQVSGGSDASVRSTLEGGSC